MSLFPSEIERLFPYTPGHVPSTTYAALNVDSATLAGPLALTNNATFGTLAVNGASLAVGGASTLTGAATLSSTLSVGGATTLTGAATLSSTLSVAGAATLTGAATLSSTLSVAGAATLTGAVGMVGSMMCASASLNNTVSLGSYLEVSGDETLASTLSAPSLSTMGDVSMEASVDVASTLVLGGSAAGCVDLEPCTVADNVDYFATFLGHNQRCVRVGEYLYATVLVSSAGDSPRTEIDYTSPSTVVYSTGTLLYNPSTRKAFSYVDALTPHPGQVKVLFSSIWALMGSSNNGRTWHRLLQVQYSGQDVRPPCIEAWDPSAQGSLIYVIASTTTGDSGALVISTYAPLGEDLGAVQQSVSISGFGTGKFTSFILRTSVGAALLVANHHGQSGQYNVAVLPLDASTGAFQVTSDGVGGFAGAQFPWSNKLQGVGGYGNWVFQLFKDTGTSTTAGAASSTFLQYPFFALDESTAANQLLFGTVNVSYDYFGVLNTADYNSYSAARLDLTTLVFTGLDGGAAYTALPIYALSGVGGEYATQLNAVRDPSLGQFMNALAGSTHYVHALSDERTRAWDAFTVACRYTRRPKGDVGGGGPAISTLALTASDGTVLQRGYALLTWGTTHLYAVGQPAGRPMVLVLLHSGDEGSSWTNIGSSSLNNTEIYRNIYGVSGVRAPVWYAGKLSVILLVGLFKKAPVLPPRLPP